MLVSLAGDLIDMRIASLECKDRCSSLTWFVVALTAYIGFALCTTNLTATHKKNATSLADSVVLPATFQVVMYLGDRYLAANIETTRVLMAGEAIVSGSDQDYLYRIHSVVADLNQCHEDNYYVANALLSWGGNVDAALDILRSATQCRFWDEVPPFFLGYNLYFFKYQYKQAKDALFLAADRSTENSTAFRRFGLMIEAENIPNAITARNYLVAQREDSRDKKLKEMLTLRIVRLDGLITLRDAQARYEKRLGRPLTDPQSLLTSGVLREFPNDPIRLGYTFSNGVFALKEVGVRGATRPGK
ncbi:MAG: hypothetical protein IPP41_07840 [Rhodocyclaceae bacterium]|nr:hypothetical protein [Rhodocyclaceae bacterium]